jgi:membrane-anchored protein YejM (alkaline phosphatase superfamily)
VNRDLPGFIVLGDQRGATIGGAGVWGNGFLPAAYQGTLFRNGSVPIVDVNRPHAMTEKQQRAELDMLKWLNERHAAERTNTSELDARIAAYELAFRMQSKAPELVDLRSESEATRKLYGLDNPVAEPFGRQCLLARRMVERGVRYVMVLHGAGPDRWDDHGDILGRIPKHCQEVDRPVAGLIKDLKARGLLDETLVVWASEMGRTPFDNNLVTDKPGRDHNQYGLVVWMAGGDVKPGATFGETDDLSVRSAGEPIPLRDVHATILRLVGLDQQRLSFLHAGRYKRLTDIGGRVINEVISA